MRVIAGTYKKMALKGVSGEQTRPTGDMVKEALFQMLGPFFPKGKMLDAYAGSGAIGIEAVSRGMTQAVFVERSHTARLALTENIERTHAAECFELLPITAMDAYHLLEQRGDVFDFVYLDPPYGVVDLMNDLRQLDQAELVRPGGIVVCETSPETELPLAVGDFKQVEVKEYPATHLSFYRQISAEEEDD